MSVVRLTHFTDTHLYGGENQRLRGVATLPALTTALAQARSHDWPPDAVLVSGDLVNDDPAGYPHFRRLFGALGLPVLCVAGNHDDPQAMRRELAGEPFVLGGFVDLGRWRIVLLDSVIPGSARGAISEQSLADLDDCARERRPAALPGVSAPSPGADGQPLARQRRTHQCRRSSCRPSTATRTSVP